MKAAQRKRKASALPSRALLSVPTRLRCARTLKIAKPSHAPNVQLCPYIAHQKECVVGESSQVDGFSHPLVWDGTEFDSPGRIPLVTSPSIASASRPKTAGGLQCAHSSTESMQCVLLHEVHHMLGTRSFMHKRLLSNRAFMQCHPKDDWHRFRC